MNKIFLIASTIALFSCGQNTPQDSKTSDTSNVSKVNNTSPNSITPAIDELKINPIDVSGNLGQITFDMNNKNIFYFDLKAQSGKVNIDGTDYNIDKFSLDNSTNSYQLSGKEFSISAPNCKFDENEGSDCNYGTIPSVTITMDKKSVVLNNVSVQDCPDY